jgi:hypothetical protein
MQQDTDHTMDTGLGVGGGGLCEGDHVVQKTPEWKADLEGWLESV